MAIDVVKAYVNILSYCRRCALGLLIGLVLSSCGTSGQVTSGSASPQPTPSIAPFFSEPRTPTPTVRVTPTHSTTPQPSVVPQPTNTATTPTPVAIEVVSLYDEKLNPNWSLAKSSNVRYDPASKVTTQQGQVALMARPTKGFGKLFLTVRQGSRETYLSDRVLGVRFWISGGDHMIAASDLAVAIVGSNTYPYWVAADTSVQINATITPDAPLFSETRLYDLGINRSIPPNTWVEVVVWLDSLQFEPTYQYITGIYVKNDDLFVEPFYLDNVDLLLQSKP